MIISGRVAAFLLAGLEKNEWRARGKYPAVPDHL